MYEIDPEVQAKLASRSDRAAIESKLRDMPPAQQRRWVANPAVEYLLQGFLNQILGGMVAGSNTKSTFTARVAAAQKGTIDKREDDKAESGNDSDAGDMFGLFD